MYGLDANALKCLSIIMNHPQMLTRCLKLQCNEVTNPVHPMLVPPKWRAMELMGRDVHLNSCIMEDAVTYDEHGTDVSSAEL